MATDLLFPFYEIFVNYIFGSIGLSLLVLGVILAIILALCRSSRVLITYWLSFYMFVVFTFYIGAMGILLGFIIGGIYFATQLIRIVSPDR